MSVSSSFSMLSSQIQAALQTDIAGNPDLFATMVTSATASAVTMGLIQLSSPPTPPVTPPTPGFSAMRSQLISALNLDIAGNPSLFANSFAAAVSVLSPVVSPTGFSLLANEVEIALNLDIAGNPNLFANIVAKAIITYFINGKVF